MPNSPGATWSANAERWEELIPVIHMLVYDRYTLDNKDKDLNRPVLRQLAIDNKAMLADNANEHLFVEKVIKDYGETFLNTTEYKTS
tara:strand:+ start:467 stop:727 length:261 start_codon:yes stop_codon:yes gene_type:complete